MTFFRFDTAGVRFQKARKRPTRAGRFQLFLSRPNYLVGDGFAVFVFVVTVVDVEFDVWLAFELIVEVEFVEFDGAVVVVDDEFVTVVDVAFEFIAFMFDRFVFVLLAVSPPQAIPRAVRPKSAESAIALFILKTISCLLQRLILRTTVQGRPCPKTLSIFGTNEMIGI